MKSIAIPCAAFLGFAATVFADPGLVDLRVSPDRDMVYKSDGAEVVFDINLQGRNSTSPRHTPINLALVIDHSGSMEEDHKIQNARRAACIAIDQLQPTDTFSLVQFDDHVDVLVPAQPVEDKKRLKQIVKEIEPGGSTALYAGVEEGARQLRKYFDERSVNRVILVSDGIANVGPSSPDELADMAREFREKGESVSTVGLGDDYNEDVMTSIAEASGANYYYVRDPETLPDVMEKELGEVKNAVAQNLRVIIEVPDGIQPVEVIGMPAVHFNGRKAIVDLGPFYASQRRDLLIRCRIKSPRGESAEIGSAHVEYTSPGDGKNCESDGVANVKFTDNRDEAGKSLNTDVATQAALAGNAASRRRALELQDSGKLQEAAAVLRNQAKADAAFAASAPASPANSKLSSEAATLGAVAGQLDSAQPMGNDERKAFQYENYNQSNQKDQR